MESTSNGSSNASSTEYSRTDRCLISAPLLRLSPVYTGTITHHKFICTSPTWDYSSLTVTSSVKGSNTGMWGLPSRDDNRKLIFIHSTSERYQLIGILAIMRILQPTVSSQPTASEKHGPGVTGGAVSNNLRYAGQIPSISWTHPEIGKTWPSPVTEKGLLVGKFGHRQWYGFFVCRPLSYRLS